MEEKETLVERTKREARESYQRGVERGKKTKQWVKKNKKPLTIGAVIGFIAGSILDIF